MKFKCIKKCFVDRIYYEDEVVNTDMSKNTNFVNLNPVASKPSTSAQTVVVVEPASTVIAETEAETEAEAEAEAEKNTDDDTEEITENGVKFRVKKSK